MDAVLPELPRPAGLLDPDLALLSLRATLVAHARGTGVSDGSNAAEPVVALLSDGVGTPAWFEHRTLANTADLMLVGPDDLLAEGGVVRHAQTRERIHVLYLRLDGELIDIRTRSGVPIGEASWTPRPPGQSYWRTHPATASPMTRPCTATCPS